MDLTKRTLINEALKQQINDLLDNKVEKVFIKATSNEGFINGLFATVTTTEDGVSRSYRTPMIVDGSNGVAILYLKYGVSYSVAVDAYGATSPTSQSFTADRTEREVNFRYSCDMAPLGVWCEATDGTLLAAADWSGSGKTAQSVVVVTAEHQFRVGLTNTTPGTCAWGGYGTNIAAMTDMAEIGAINDFDTKGETDKMIAALNPNFDGEALTDGYTSGHIDSSTNIYSGGTPTKGAPAAEACRVYSSGNIGAGRWDLPTFGVLYLMYINKAAINACLTAMGGTALTEGWHWSSTESSANYAWGLDLSSGRQGYDSKNSAYSVRAVAAF